MNTTTGIILAGYLTVLVAAPVWASDAELVEWTIVTETALTFAAGPATKFSTTVNGRSHQQTPLVTCRGHQYVTYFDDERRLCVGRRKLPGRSWDVIQFKDHRIASNDSHNTSVIGICDVDGTIHLAFDHHATPLNYRVSKLGAAHDPDSVQWDAELFGPVAHTLGSVVTDQQVTYPRFFSTPSGHLMLYYRAVTSGNGDGMIERYDGNKHDWTRGWGRFIARDIGTYTFSGQTSQYRCPYMNSLSYAGGRLHASWVWRDRFERTKVENQHDLCYACSDDDGRTWCNSAGEVIGITGAEPIHLNSPRVVVAPLVPHSGLKNQNTHYAYSDGSIHVVMGHDLGGSSESRYHHFWRTGQGDWHQQVLPFTGSRPKLVGAEDRTLVLIFTTEDDEGKTYLQIALGHPDSGQTSWQWDEVRLPKPHSVFGDALLDLNRWEEEKVLSIYGQQEPSRLIETDKHEAIDGFPSPLNVVDYRLNLDLTTE